MIRDLAMIGVSGLLGLIAGWTAARLSQTRLYHQLDTAQSDIVELRHRLDLQKSQAVHRALVEHSEHL